MGTFFNRNDYTDINDYPLTTIRSLFKFAYQSTHLGPTICQ